MSYDREFLERAELYAESKGDGSSFSKTYQWYRESVGVADSARLTLASLYGDDVADQVFFMLDRQLASPG